ncbi:hypothetical protein D3C80_2096410 [compost metagenome]|jgi:hypothetical protein
MIGVPVNRLLKEDKLNSTGQSVTLPLATASAPLSDKAITFRSGAMQLKAITVRNT